MIEFHDLQNNYVSFHAKSRTSSLSMDFRITSFQSRGRPVVCMSVQQASKSKVAVSPLSLEDAKDPPLHLFKNKEPYTGTIVSVERLVGPQAPGETCHIVIDHGGKVPYWEGQSYGIIPPVCSICIFEQLVFFFTLAKCETGIFPENYLIKSISVLSEVSSGRISD